MAIVALFFSILAVALALGLAAWLWLDTASANDDDGAFGGLTGLGLEGQLPVAGRTPL